MSLRFQLFFVLLLFVISCRDEVAPLTSCADPLGGVWSIGGTQTWHLFDNGKTIEGFPIVRELPDEPPGTLAAPSLLELHHGPGSSVTGTLRRRWQRGARTCWVVARAIMRACTADRATLELGPTGAPADWDSCDPPDGRLSVQLLRRTWVRL